MFIERVSSRSSNSRSSRRLGRGAGRRVWYLIITFISPSSPSHYIVGLIAGGLEWFCSPDSTRRNNNTKSTKVQTLSGIRIATSYACVNPIVGEIFLAIKNTNHTIKGGIDERSQVQASLCRKGLVFWHKALLINRVSLARSFCCERNEIHSH